VNRPLASPVPPGTFFSVFPEATVLSNNLNGDGFDLVLIGQLDDALIDVDSAQRRLDQPSYSSVGDSVGGIEVPAPYTAGPSICGLCL
jgi:hypothetical protein